MELTKKKYKKVLFAFLKYNGVYGAFMYESKKQSANPSKIYFRYGLKEPIAEIDSNFEKTVHPIDKYFLKSIISYSFVFSESCLGVGLWSELNNIFCTKIYPIAFENPTSTFSHVINIIKNDFNSRHPK